MEKRILCGLKVLLLIVVWLSTVASAESEASRAMLKSRLPVLSHEEFADRFGDNPRVPQTDGEVLALAEKLFPPPAQEHELKAGARPACGTTRHGELEAALRNPAISDGTRKAVEQIMALGLPDFDKTGKRIGHFVFSYCTKNPEPKHNVTGAHIKALATALNKYWDVYSKRFTVPAHYEKKSGKRKLQLISVLVYAIPPDADGRPWSGFTTSEGDVIFLNSEFMRDDCNRLTVSAHELFHRVQFTYGYKSGTRGMAWMVEGTASWAQKFTNNGIKDYMDAMNDGLRTPNERLFTDRDYDACHFWVHLQERAKSTAIRDIWAFGTRPNRNPIRMTKNLAIRAINSVLKESLHMELEQFLREWHIANFAKDLDGIEPWFDYADDECRRTNPCGVYYPGLEHVPTQSATISAGLAPYGRFSGVAVTGAEYYVFDLDPSIDNVQLTLNGAVSARFSYYLVGIKNNMKVQDYSFNQLDVTFTRALGPGEWDKLGVVVMGMEGAPVYTISCKTLFTPHVVGSVTLPDTALAVDVAGSYAYLAIDDYGLQIVDVSNPASPQLRGRYDTPGKAVAVDVVGTIAYVADQTGGVQIINVSDPDNPQFVGQAGSAANGVKVVGNYAYVAARQTSGYGYLRIFDISNPAYPQVGSEQLEFNSTAQAIAVYGQHAYVTDSHAGALYVIDIQNPAAPNWIGTAPLNFPTHGVFATSNYVYVANGNLQVVDVSNPASPTVVGALVGGAEYTVYVQSGSAFAGGAGLVSLNVTNPLTPVFNYFVDTPDYVRGVHVSGAYAYAAAANTLQVVAVSQ
jgi:hypothetical protein